ncbi:MAG: hypothetical protein EOP91_14270 [Lysobacteraceae bacterium]|nr:MAG: hypothetical protein EOP91_14270 [Xanthomonadaceae bacterium]
MTRSSPAWLWIAFFVALVGVGFRYWQPASHQRWPLELGIALALGLGCALLGTGLGSLLLLRSSRRPQ